MSDTTAPPPDATPTTPPTPTPEPAPAKPPKTTPGALPAVPALTIGAASLASALGAVGTTIGPAGLAGLAGAGAIAAGAKTVNAARSGGLRRTVTKTTRARSAGTRGTARRGTGLGRATRGTGRPTARGTGRRGSGTARRGAPSRGMGRGTAASRPAARGKALAARRARADAKRATRTAAAAQRRLTRAETPKSHRSHLGRKPRPTGTGTGTPRRGMGRGTSRGSGTGRRGTTTGRRSPAARIARAHKTNNRRAQTAQRAQAARTRRRAAADARHDRRVRAARHRQRLAPLKRSITKRVRLARRRFRHRMALAALAAAPLLAVGTYKALRYGGTGATDLARDTYRHILGAARLQRGVELAQAYNTEHGIHPIPDTITTTKTGLHHTGPITPRSHTMGTFDFRTETEDILAKARSGELGGALEFVAVMDTLPETLQAFADAFVVVASRSVDEMPIDPKVADALAEVHRHLTAAADAAPDVSKVLHAAHADDIERLENPRTNEQAWDVTANQ